jgi:serine/threonine protein kinase
LGTVPNVKAEFMNANQDNSSDPLLQLSLSKQQEVGGWEIQDELGKGGFGRAYKVEKVLHVGESTVRFSAVLKVVNSTIPDTSNAKHMLVNEIRQLSRVNSRYVANFRDAGIYEDGLKLAPYLVVDFIEGATLKALIEERAKHRSGLSDTKFKTLAENTLRGLYGAHSKDVLHLDIKPDNIIYSAVDDAFVIIDFGLAVLSHRDTINTFRGGTYGYIAPEEYISETSRMSDIFSLGMTFYEAATGFNPIQRTLAEYLEKNDPQGTNVTRAAQIATDITIIDYSILSSDKRALIEPMLEHDPKKRPSLERLISMASELSSGSLADGTSSMAQGSDNEDWVDGVLKIVSSQPIDNVKLTIDHEDHFQIWFKTKLVDGEIVMICSKPKDYLSLGDIGWRPYQPGILIFRFESKPSPEIISELAIKSITHGFGLSMPFTFT